jgi:hypothetical protein
MKVIKERDIVCFIGGFFSATIVGTLGLAILLSLAGCTTSRPVPPMGPQVEAMPDSLPILPYLREVKRLDSLALAGWLPRDYTNLPAYLVPAPAGSTPRQRRQWQKAQVQNLARAGVQPTKIKNSSVATAPGAVAINRPTSAVATGSGVATDARKAGTRGGSAAVGPGAVATGTRNSVPWWVYLLVAVGGAIGWELLARHVVPAAWLPWRVGAA